MKKKSEKSINVSEKVISSYENININYEFLQSGEKPSKLLKLESLGKGGFGEVSVYYDHNIGQALAVKQFDNEENYIQEKETNRNSDTLIDKNKYFACMLSFSDEKYMIFFELGDCTLLEVNNFFQLKDIKWNEIELVYITYSLLNGLIYMRQNQMFHSDISPDNVMIFQNMLKYIDLGSSHLNNNKLYLKQYKKQFVNFDIQRPNKNYSADEITQNELYALSRTITHLCLYDSQEREDIIINKNLKNLNELKLKFKTFKKQLYKSKCLKDYPKIRKILIKMQYPFDEDEEKPQSNNQPTSSQEKDKKINSKRNTRNSKIDKQDKKQNNKNDKSNKDAVDFDAAERVQDIPLKKLQKKEKFDKCDEIKTLVEKTNMMTTVLQTEEEDEENKDEQNNVETKILDDKEKTINDVMFECVNQLQYILNEYVKENNIKINQSQKNSPPYDFEAYSFIFENSEVIQDACQQIRSQRLEKLLQNHPDPNKEISYLMQLDQKNWRRETAFQVIITKFANPESSSFSKELVAEKLIYIILHQQKMIMLRQKTFNIECADFIEDIISLSYQYALAIVEIECIFTFCLIWYFQESKVDFDHFYLSFNEKYNKEKKNIQDNTQLKKFEILETINKLFNDSEQSLPIREQIQILILEQIKNTKSS